MSSNSSPFVPLMLAALTAVGAAIGIQKLGTGTANQKAKAVATTPALRWAASAPGRVEPKNGEIKLSVRSPGRVTDILVKVNDKVQAGDLLLRTDDDEAKIRIMIADAEAGVRKRERDTETNVPRLSQDRRTAEDNLNNTERAIAIARQELDRLLIERQKTGSSVTAEQVQAQRKAIDEALQRLEKDRNSYRDTKLANGVPLPTRLEAGLTAARMDLSLAELALERARLRAPRDATVLQVLAKVGEFAAVTPEQTVIILGDVSALSVKAEVEERDVANVTLGQDVILRTPAFPGRDFKGRVSTIAHSMRPPKLAQRGPLRPNDLDTLEVLVDVEAGSPLLPGMRVDVFFQPPALAGSATKTEAPKTEATMLAPAQTGANPAPAAPATGTTPQVLPPLQSDKPANPQ